MKIDGKNYSFIDKDGNVAGEAILFMRSQPLGPDSTIGFMVEPGTNEWLAWEAYFNQYDHDPKDGSIIDRFPRQKPLFRLHGQQRKPFMVPAQVPWIFDRTFDPKSVRPKPREPHSGEMPLEQREAIILRFKRAHIGQKEAAE